MQGKSFKSDEVRFLKLSLVILTKDFNCCNIHFMHFLSEPTLLCLVPLVPVEQNCQCFPFKKIPSFVFIVFSVAKGIVKHEFTQFQSSYL